MHTCARARKQNPQHDILVNARTAAKGGGEKMFQTEVVMRLSGWAFWIDGNKDTPCTRAHAHENAINRTIF